MTAWMRIPAERRALLETLAAEYAQHYARGRTILAVDGFDGAGKTVFADDLAQALRRAGHEVFRASVDDFHRPRELRYRRGRHSAEGYYRDSFDYSVLRRVLVEPFRMAGSTGFVTAAFDLRRDAPIEPVWLTGPPDAVLVVDGVFLHRPELRGLWNWSIWLDADAGIRAERMAVRDGSVPETGSPLAERYDEGQRLYVADASPREAASVIVDNTDADRPHRVFDDRC
jgi:uridine kinase